MSNPAPIEDIETWRQFRRIQKAQERYEWEQRNWRMARLAEYLGYEVPRATPDEIWHEICGDHPEDDLPPKLDLAD